jgi:hypothetical protein
MSLVLNLAYFQTKYQTPTSIDNLMQGGPHRGANSVDAANACRLSNYDLRRARWAEFGPVMDLSIQTVHMDFDQLVFVWHYRPYKNVKQFLEQVMPCQRLTVHLPDSEHVYWEGFDSNNRKHWYHLVEFYMKTKALENLRIVEFIRKEEVILAYVQGKST